MENEERKKLEEEYKNLKLLIEFHSTYGVLEKSEYEKMVNDILDRMNEIRKMLEKSRKTALPTGRALKIDLWINTFLTQTCRLHLRSSKS